MFSWSPTSHPFPWSWKIPPNFSFCNLPLHSLFSIRTTKINLRIWMNEILLQIFCRFLLQYVLFLYETIQTKNVTNCGKSPKGESLCTFFWGYELKQLQQLHWLQLQWTINVDLIFCLSLPQAKLLYTVSNSNGYHVKLRSLTKSPTPRLPWQAQVPYKVSNSNSCHGKLKSLTKSPTLIAVMASLGLFQSLQLQYLQWQA